MNISLMRLKPAVRELAGIRKVLERIADCMEADLAEKGYNVRPPVTKTEGPEPTISYIDEEMDWAKERSEFLQREEKRLAEEAESDGLNVFKHSNE